MTDQGKHSPAPWWHGVDGKDGVIVAANGEHVARVPDDFFRADAAEHRANRDLIAAAPDLLEAVKQHWCGSCGYRVGEPGIGFHHHGSCSNCDPLRAIVAKATGESADVR